MKGSQYALVPAKRNGSPSSINFVPFVYGTPLVHPRFVIPSSNGHASTQDAAIARPVAVMNFMITQILCQIGTSKKYPAAHRRNRCPEIGDNRP